jgi:hypothetical protein
MQRTKAHILVLANMQLIECTQVCKHNANMAIMLNGIALQHDHA